METISTINTKNQASTDLEAQNPEMPSNNNTNVIVVILAFSH